MSAKQKAKKLVEKFRQHANIWDCYNDSPSLENNDKKCALIAVNEILLIANQYGVYGEIAEYWKNVKIEIEKL